MLAALYGGTAFGSAIGALDGDVVWAVALTVPLAALGLLDDARPLSAKFRFAVHVAVATAFCFVATPVQGVELPFIGAVPFSSLAIPVTVFWLVGMTNLYNFMDGIDGLAGGMAVIGSTFCAALLLASGGGSVGTAFVIAGAASLGFLFHNHPPAKVFMGDVGSGALGFLFGALAILGSERFRVPFLSFLLVFGAFVFDTSVTLLRRIARGEKWYAAHRSHLYQRLLIAGWSHLRVDSLEYAMMLLLGSLALAYLRVPSWVQAVLLLTSLALLSCFAVLVSHVEGCQRPSQRSDLIRGQQSKT